MKFSEMLIPTLKEDPAEAEVVSHKLLLRAGFIRKLTSGIYTYLPMGLRALRKIEQIVREEMDAAGAQEILMPMVQPADLWAESGRLEKYGPELLRFVDRHNRQSCLGPTHEEVITDLVRNNVHSYRGLPLNFYQIQAKFRDEIRPRFGLMRGREFVMKDAYSFDVDEQGAEIAYEKMKKAYHQIFTRCGLSFRAVEADTGTIGGSFSHEFMVLADTGEDTLVTCKQCSYAANLEKAACKPRKGGSDVDVLPLQKIETPGKRKVGAVTDFLNISAKDLVKTLVYMADGKPVAVLLRGDHEVQPVKLKNLLGVNEVELATDKEAFDAAGVPTGYLGPINIAISMVADLEVPLMKNFTVGGNEKNYHCLNANFGRDFQIEQERIADLRMITPDDNCPSCGGELELTKGIEVGHIFKLGTAYSEALGASFLDSDGKEKPFVMGCYGIGVSRVIAAAIEQNHDKDGIIFPMPIAPFQVALLNLMPKEEEICEAANRLYTDLSERGLEVLLDDRDERPGSKFKDADLLGIPVRVTVGKRFKNDGLVELKMRASGEAVDLSVAEAVDKLAEIWAACQS